MVRHQPVCTTRHVVHTGFPQPCSINRQQPANCAIPTSFWQHQLTLRATAKQISTPSQPLPSLPTTSASTHSPQPTLILDAPPTSQGTHYPLILPADSSVSAYRRLIHRTSRPTSAQVTAPSTDAVNKLHRLDIEEPLCIIVPGARLSRPDPVSLLPDPSVSVPPASACSLRYWLPSPPSDLRCTPLPRHRPCRQTAM